MAGLFNIFPKISWAETLSMPPVLWVVNQIAHSASLVMEPFSRSELMAKCCTFNLVITNCCNKSNDAQLLLNNSTNMSKKILSLVILRWKLMVNPVVRISRFLWQCHTPENLVMISFKCSLVTTEKRGPYERFSGRQTGYFLAQHI